MPNTRPTPSDTTTKLRFARSIAAGLLALSPLARAETLASGAGAPKPEFGQPFSFPDLGLEMRPIPAGTFLMGSPSDEPGRDREGETEEPQTRVTISKPFWLGRTDVTVGQWQRVMGTDLATQARRALADDTLYNTAANVSNFVPAKMQTLRDHWRVDREADPASRLLNTDADLPMYFVSWYDAMDFCRQLNERARAAGTLPAGYEFQLPTEAQWEYACRAGTTTATYNGPIRIVGQYDAPVLDAIAWYGGNSSVGYRGKGVDTSAWRQKQYPGGRAGPRAVATKRPNAWGLYDMLGNLWQWCLDPYAPLPGGSVTDPVGRDTGAGIVGKGGSWRTDPTALRAARRDGDFAGFRGANRGFRVALAPIPAPPPLPRPDPVVSAIAWPLQSSVSVGPDPTVGLEGVKPGKYDDVPTNPYDAATARNATLTRLVERPGPESGEAVLAGLLDPDAGVRQIALSNLDLAGSDPRALSELRSELERADPRTRWLAARAIATMPAALLGLSDKAAKCAADPDPLVRRALLANIAPGDGVAKIARPWLAAALEGPDLGDRMAAAQSWSRLEFEAPEGWLDRRAAELASPDPEIAGAAAYELNLLWNGLVEERVRRLAAGGPWEQRVHAADLLRKRKAEVDPSWYAGVFADGSEAVQLYACGTLSRLPGPGAADRLREAGSSRYPSVRQAAVYALEPNRSGAAREALLGLLDSSDPNVRYRTAIVLGRSGSASAKAKLESLAVSDPDPEVRSAAAIATATDYARVLPPMAGLPLPAGARAPRVTDPHGIATGSRDGVLQVGTQKQLLVDDFSLASLGGAKRVFHKFKKDPRNPILEQQFPWEYAGLAAFVVAVAYDRPSGMLRLYYGSNVPNPTPLRSQGNPADVPDRLQRSQLVAVSADGRHWTRPNIGLYENQGTKANNLVSLAEQVFALSEPYAGRYRYASLTPIGKRDTFYTSVTFSPDGISGWTPYRALLPAAGDVSTAAPDGLGGGVFGFTKWRSLWWLGESFGDTHAPHQALKMPTLGGRGFASVFGPNPASLQRGRLNLRASADDDRLAFRRVAAAFPGIDAFSPDETHSEIYLVTPFPYEGVYFAIPTVFYPSGRGGGNDDGLELLSLMFSRDRSGASGWTPNGGGHLEPVVDLGRWGEWDSTRFQGPNSMVVVNDEIVLYYCGSPYGHEAEGWRLKPMPIGPGKPYYRSAIGRATLRLDGFASLHAGAEEAVIVTKKLSFSGDRLVINARGQVAAEVLDAAGRPVPGFGKADCAAFSGDALRHSLAWSGGSLGSLAGKTVQLRFYLRNGDLYSYGFSAGEPLSEIGRNGKAPP